MKYRELWCYIYRELTTIRIERTLPQMYLGACSLVYVLLQMFSFQYLVLPINFDWFLVVFCRQSYLK